MTTISGLQDAEVGVPRPPLLLRWCGLDGQQVVNKSGLLDHTNHTQHLTPPTSSHHCLLATTHHPQSQFPAIPNRVFVSSPARPSRTITLSLRKHVGCPVSRQAAHAPSTRPATSTVAHTPGFEGSRGPDEGRRGGQRGPKRGSTAMPLADSQTRVAIYATQCDGGIIVVAVPSSRQGLLYCPPTTRGVASTTARYHCSSPEPG